MEKSEMKVTVKLCGKVLVHRASTEHPLAFAIISDIHLGVLEARPFFVSSALPTLTVNKQYSSTVLELTWQNLPI